jgi:hypothetical protein
LVAVSGAPGSGAPTRGRGDAEMIWGSESPGQSDAFKPKQLPTGRYLDPAHTALAGVSAADPTVDPKGEAAGDVATAAAQARSAWRRRIAPAHREAVKRFFAPVDDGGGK